jgi:hypothetical protein
MPSNNDFEVPSHLLWKPPAANADPDHALRIEAHNARVQATNDAMMNGAALVRTPTFEELKAAQTAKLAQEAALEASRQAGIDAEAKAKELEASMKKLELQIERKEHEARLEAVDERMRIIQSERRARNRPELKAGELRTRAVKSLREK